MFLIHVYQNRTRDFSTTIYDAAGEELTLAADDVVRLKIGRNGSTPLLDLDSVAPSPNDSQLDFTVGTGDVTVKIAAADTADWEAGAYDAEMSVYDDDETELRMAEQGTVMVHPTLGGEAAGEEESSSS